VCTLYRYEINLPTAFRMYELLRNVFLLNCNGDGSLSKKQSNSVCIIIVLLLLLLLLLLWIWMTAQLEATRRTSSFLRPFADKEAKLSMAWKAVTSSGSWQVYNKSRWQTILLSSCFLLLFNSDFVLSLFLSLVSFENWDGQSRWIGLARWKYCVKSGARWRSVQGLQWTFYANCA
jgi:hypothetical protein